MNRARIAWLLRELAEEIDPSREATESGPSLSEVKRQRAAKPLTDLDKARARKSLRRLGVDL